MKDMTAPVLAGLAVLYALGALLSAAPTSSGSSVVKSQEGVSDLGSLLIQTIMVQQHQQSKDDNGASDADRTMKVQQALKAKGFYSGPVDGVMRKKTQQAIELFQQSKHLKVTGTINDETARELRIR